MTSTSERVAGGQRPAPETSSPPSTWTAVPMDAVLDLDRVARLDPGAVRRSRGEVCLERDGFEVRLWSSGVVLFVGARSIPDSLLRWIEHAARAGWAWRDAEIWGPADGAVDAPRRDEGVEEREDVLRRFGPAAAQRLLAERVVLNRCWRLVEAARLATAPRIGATLSLAGSPGRQFAASLAQVRLQHAAWAGPPGSSGAEETASAALAWQWSRLEAQLVAVDGVWATLRQEWNQRHGHRLEWLIILLIALDIAIVWLASGG